VTRKQRNLIDRWQPAGKSISGLIDVQTDGLNHFSRRFSEFILSFLAEFSKILPRKTLINLRRC